MNILLTGAFPFTEEQVSLIKSLGFDVVYVRDEKVQLTLDATKIDAVVCNGLFLYNDISCFSNLKYIQLTSAGLDRVPLDYIRENKIELRNAADVYSVPMAEWIVLKILEIYKKSRAFYTAQNERLWYRQRDLKELKNKTALIIGFGNVGYETAKRLRAFDIRIIGVDSCSVEPSRAVMADAIYAPEKLDDLLPESDVVILSLPLTKSTYKMINAQRLAAMKNGSVLINVSRGDLIDEEALLSQIEADKFLGVALDVFSKEPLPVDHPLWSCENTLITPHISFLSDNVSDRLFAHIKQNLISFLKDHSEKSA